MHDYTYHTVASLRLDPTTFLTAVELATVGLATVATLQILP